MALSSQNDLIRPRGKYLLLKLHHKRNEKSISVSRCLSVPFTVFVWVVVKVVSCTAKHNLHMIIDHWKYPKLHTLIHCDKFGSSG
jgi:hypothetical protein